MRSEIEKDVEGVTVGDEGDFRNSLPRLAVIQGPPHLRDSQASCFR